MWLYNVDSSRILLLAHRFLAKNCFANQIIPDKYIFDNNSNYIISELQLSRDVIQRINDREYVRYLRKVLQDRI